MAVLRIFRGSFLGVPLFAKGLLIYIIPCSSRSIRRRWEGFYEEMEEVCGLPVPFG